MGILQHSMFRKVLRSLVILAVTLALVWLAFSNIEFDTLLDDLKQANYFWVIISVIIGYLAFVSRGMRWVLVVDSMGYKASAWNAIHAVTLGYFANMFVPRAGEIARCTSLSKTDDIPVDKLLGTVIAERVVDMIFLLTFILAAIILQFDNFMTFLADVEAARQTEDGSTSMLSKFIYILGGGFVVAIVLLFIFRKRIIASRLFSKIKAFVVGMKVGVTAIFTMKRKGAFVLHSLFIWTVYYLIIYLNFFALSQTTALGFADGVFMTVAGGLGMLVPAQGGIGSYHLAVTYAMLVLGKAYAMPEILSYQTGLTYATLIHTSQALMILISGAVALILLSLAGKKRKQSA